MAQKVYVGTSQGIRPNVDNGYFNTGYTIDPTKQVHIEVVCKFDDTTTYTTVMRKSL